MTDEQLEKAIKCWTGTTVSEKECMACPYNDKCTLEEIANEIIHRWRECKTENAALRERLEKSVELPFIVIDKKTGKEADVYDIYLHEDWAKHLMYCDIEGFAIEQDGTIILLDECGQFVYCSSDRFEVVSEARLAELKGEEE